MSENSPKILSFRLFGEVFHSALREHCATVRHTARFWRRFHSVPCNSFVHFSAFLSGLFSFILIKVIFGAFLQKQLFYSGLNHTPISYISQTKQKKGEMNLLPRTYKRKTRAASAHRDDWLTAATFSVRDLVKKIATHAKEMAHTPIPDIDFFLCTSVITE